MALEKYKICPSCGEHNPPVLLECRRCESDLTGVRVVDATTEQVQKETVTETEGTQSALVRICECGATNPPQARKCNTCGEDISDIRPTYNTDKRFSYSLSSIDGAMVEHFDEPVTILGREAGLKEFLLNRSYVSRRHAKLTVVAEKVFIENLGATNRTFVNNKPIESDTPTALNDGDEIGLGGKTIEGKRQELAAYFIFQVRK